MITRHTGGNLLKKQDITLMLSFKFYSFIYYVYRMYQFHLDLIPAICHFIIGDWYVYIL